ncbi:MAG TPA: glycoside hydrolase family 3 C-terminal domain-containing protein, partial [Ignavibacteriaceae bacterium]|nr:glycoside hydrolase family 3 C-terminal domain-containing protein [Ignavibacteriaceae bacterium]
SLAEKYGTALGQETKAKGRDVILGPCVNIARIPQGGRDFESFGEDPYLTSRIAVNYIKGVQKENVAATIKHFACNNQEFQRDFVDVKVDERALNEIYLPSFKAAVQEAGVLCVMSAYNRLNGSYCSENEYLLKKKLKDEWGFKGLVMSDWGAVHSTMPTVLNGLDLEMPTGVYLNDSAITKGIDESLLNDKIRRILKVMFTIGLFDSDSNSQKPDTTIFTSSEHKQLAYQVAEESIVLLKNENNILPIDTRNLKSIAVIGPNAKTARTGGGGSSFVDPIYSISPYEGLKNKLPESIKINFAEGVTLNGDTKPIDSRFYTEKIKAEFFKNRELQGNPVTKEFKEINFDWGGDAPFEGFPEDDFSVRFSASIKAPVSGEFALNVNSDDGVRLFFNGKLVINDWNDHAAFTNTFKTNLEKDKTYDIRIEYYENGGSASVKLGWRLPGEDPFEAAVNAAKKSDLALLFVGTSNNYESEGFDRPDLMLPANQDELIDAVCKVNKKVIVVLNSGAAIVMDKWINKTAGILEVWFGGEEIGNAVADVLLGNYNPSGKLPVTFPKSWEDCSAYKTYRSMDSITYYSDGIFVGYRHFDKYKIEPLFPFGYGLSYTNFEYSNLQINGNEVSLDLKNSGNLEGSEIMQLYVKDLDASVERPEKELKRFTKVSLKPGEVRKINFTLDQRAFSFFDPAINGWKAEKGEFEILIGSSSRDIRLKGVFNL